MFSTTPRMNKHLTSISKKYTFFHVFSSSQPKRCLCSPLRNSLKCILITRLISVIIIIITTCWDFFQLSREAITEIFSNLSTIPESDLRPPSGVHCHTPVRSSPSAPARRAITRLVQFGSGCRSGKLAPSLHLSHSNYNLLKSRYPTPRSHNDSASSQRPGRLSGATQHAVNKDSVAGRKIQLCEAPSLCLGFTFFSLSL